MTLVDLKQEFASKSEILAAFTKAVDEVLRRAPKGKPIRPPMR